MLVWPPSPLRLVPLPASPRLRPVWPQPSPSCCVRRNNMAKRGTPQGPPLRAASDDELLDELSNRFSSWLFYGRKTSEAGEHLGTQARWRGDREVCMGGASYIIHNAAASIDADLEEDPANAPCNTEGYL